MALPTIMLSVIMLNVIMLNVIMLNVVAPLDIDDSESLLKRVTTFNL
jgi:hypothetical protein